MLLLVWATQLYRLLRMFAVSRDSISCAPLAGALLRRT